MPMRITVSRFERLLIGVASGDLTRQDLGRFFLEIVEGGLLDYRKIVDIAGCNPVVTAAELEAFGAVVRAAHKGGPPAPLAIVAHEQQNAVAALFAKLTADVRPAHVFRSIHEARRWIEQNSPQVASPSRRDSEP